MSRMPAGSRPVAGSSSINRRGRAQQRCRDPEPLAHPVREAADAMAGARGQLDDLEHLVDALPCAAAVERGEQLEVLARGEVGIEARRLDESGDALQSARAPSRIGSRPNSSTVPSVGMISPSAIRSVVVLPAPFGPRKP